MIHNPAKEVLHMTDLLGGVNAVEIPENTDTGASTGYIEIDCVHWLWHTDRAVIGVDVPHWLINQEGENE